MKILGDDRRAHLDDALAALQAANRRNNQKGAKLRTFIRTSFESVSCAASYVTEKKQVNNRIGEQFKRTPSDVVFLAADGDIAVLVLKEIEKRAYPALRTAAIFILADGKYALTSILVSNPKDAFAAWLIEEFELAKDQIWNNDLKPIEHEKQLSPLIVQWSSALSVPPSTDYELLGVDDAFQQAVTALRKKSVILLGAPGVGKSSLASFICRSLQVPFDAVTATAEWTAIDTIGGYFPARDGALNFRSGLIVRAMEANKWIVIDEINRADIDKAFGEMFTVLSGQPVTLPYFYTRDENEIPIVLGARTDAADAYGIPLDDDWRIIGTMNTVDKSSLFNMSAAFMRRFAFVEIPVPDDEDFIKIIDAQLPSDEVGKLDLISVGFEHLRNAFARSGDVSLRSSGCEIGPAIVIDCANYLLDLAADQPVMATTEALIQCYTQFVLPQLEGRDELLQAFQEKLPNLLGLKELPRSFTRNIREWFGV